MFDGSLRPAYFVIRRLYGRETPEIYWDYLPRESLRAVVYITRLDQLPFAETLIRLPLERLYAMYCDAKVKGKLPPRWEPSKKDQSRD